MEHKENKGKIWCIYEASITTAVVGKKACQGISSENVTLTSEEIEPVPIAIIKLHLSEGISY